LRGAVRIEGKPRSLMWEGAQAGLGTLIRESGF
jgi:hypothetical protein